MKSIAKIVFLPCFLFLVASCAKNEKFSHIPYVEFRSAEFVLDSDSTSNRQYLSYQLYFTDGDGDLGSDEEPAPGSKCDTLLNNLFVNYYEKYKGEYVKVEPVDKCLPFDSQIPILFNGGSNPTLEGFINARFDYLGYPYYPDVDSVKLEFQVEDESGNLSNISISPPIATPRP